MLVLAVELLGGRYVATAYNDRNVAEWPPHPARLFSALVCTWAEEAVVGSVDDRELAALTWLEEQVPPDILCSGSRDVARRSVAPVYVPVNDVSVVREPNRSRLDEALAKHRGSTDSKARDKLERDIAKLEKKLADDTLKAIAPPDKYGEADLTLRILPDLRSKQPRTFPSITPLAPRVLFQWPDVNPDSKVVAGLSALASRLVRLGHSSSLVAARLVDGNEAARLSADLTLFQARGESGTLVLRWVGPGQVDRLRAAFERHGETEPRVLPARFVRYSEGQETGQRFPEHSGFDPDVIVFARVGGPRLPIVSTVGVARQFRRALLSVAEEPIDEALSGHTPEGTPSQAPHVAIVPLPYVGSAHADGTLLGVAMVLPRVLSPASRRAVLRAVGALEKAQGRPEEETPDIPLRLGDAGTLELQRVAWGEHPRMTLRSTTWTQPSRYWVSATPVALDSNPGDLHDPDATKRAAAFELARESVRTSVLRIGLPQPLEIDVVRSTVLTGSAKPRSFPRFPVETKKLQRLLVHVRLTFQTPVLGPVILGAGRFFGLGLCLPVRHTRSDLAAGAGRQEPQESP